MLFTLKAYSKSGREVTVVQSKKTEHLDTKASYLIAIGDELVSIDNIYNLTNMSYANQLGLLKQDKRPIILGFSSREM
jgi:hypothetical protein